MAIPLVNLKRQYEFLKEQYKNKVLEVLYSASYIMGKNVNQFEKEFSKYLGVKHSIAVASGTDALVISLEALGIGKGDEVITTPFTFFATAEAISNVGAKPVFVDVDLKTYNIDVEKIEEKITDKTKAIMPVHIFGQPCNMDKINEIAKKHNLKVIEDACQAAGAEYKGRKVGTLSDIGCFSFFPTKNLSCAGDGGVIVTNDDNLATVCRALRSHGSGENGKKAYNILNNVENEDNMKSDIDSIYNPSKYYNYLIGHNSRLDEIQAAILTVKLPFLDMWNDRRREIAKFYNENLLNTDLITPFEAEDVKHVYHLYVLQSDSRSRLIEYLKDEGISTGIYYPVPLHLQKAYLDLGYKEGDLPNSEYLSKRTFAIPIFPELIDEEIDYIVSKLQKFHLHAGKDF